MQTDSINPDAVSDHVELLEEAKVVSGLLSRFSANNVDENVDQVQEYIEKNRPPPEAIPLREVRLIEEEQEY